MKKNEERKIGFVPFVSSKEDARVIVQETATLFQKGLINEVCVVSDYCVCQLLKKAGISPDKIRTLVCDEKHDETEALVLYLKFLPKELIMVHVIAVHYACPRFEAKLIRRERDNQEGIRGLGIFSKPVYPKKNLAYFADFLMECFRVAKDLAAPLILH